MASALRFVVFCTWSVPALCLAASAWSARGDDVVVLRSAPGVRLVVVVQLGSWRAQYRYLRKTTPVRQGEA